MVQSRAGGPQKDAPDSEHKRGEKRTGFDFGRADRCAPRIYAIVQRDLAPVSFDK
jgi:hypothetical protein